MSTEKKKLIAAELAAQREGAARAEFLRCLCQELRKQNATILAAETEGAEAVDQMGIYLRRAGDAARAQGELLEMLENVVRFL